MSLFRTEGVILRSLDYKEYDQILSVFSPECGLLDLFYKGGKSRKRNRGAAAAPLVHGEFIFLEKQSGLSVCREISVLSHHVEIRQRWESLEAACVMTQAVRRTQLPGKPSPLLYALFLKYLSALPSLPHPAAVATSFLLKLLKHEGHLGIFSRCSRCEAALETLALASGEPFCLPHAPPGAITFDAEESALLDVLLHGRKLSSISAFALTKGFQAKVKNMYEHIFLA